MTVNTDIYFCLGNTALKAGEPDPLRSGSQSEGQLKERSEGGQAQWQTALGEELAAGSQ